MVTSSASTPVVTSPVFRNRDPIGVIVVLPLGSPVHTRSDRSDRTADCGKSGNPSDGRYVFDDIITASPLMADAIALGQRVATSALPVLVTGESGTGKEIIAQSIHSASERSGGPFVAVNCGSITEGLVDAEFCGYEESAFTGARRGGSVGRFEQGHRGTIFLDEVTELSPRAQAALLRVLQEKEVLRVGAGTPRRVDIRVIAATIGDLSAEVKASRFRSGLFYRLNGMVITLPALRERPDDVAVLGRRFLDELPGRALLYFSAATLEALRAYRWPSNVRELHNVVHRAAIMARGPTIELDDLPCEVRALAKDSGAIPVSQGDTSERARILALLRDCQGNVDEAARRIGVSRMTLHRKIGKWSISRLVKGRKQPGPNNLTKYAFHQTRCSPAAPSAYRCEPLL